MKIKRFFAPNIRQVIHDVRQEMGPDAVILSNRQVKGGVEVVVAVDYDESLLKAENKAKVEDSKPRDDAAGKEAVKAEKKPPQWARDPALSELHGELKALRRVVEHQLCGLAWKDLNRSHPHRADLLRRFMALGLSASLGLELADQVTPDNLDEAFGEAIARLTERVPISDDDILAEGGRVALLGPTGVGKTTTVAKLAARYILRHGSRRIALLTTDSYRIGGHEQLRTLAHILGVPVHLVSDGDDLQRAVDTWADKGLVLIDTTGMGQRDARLSQQLALIQRAHIDIKPYLVLSATTQIEGLHEIIASFRNIPLKGCIITKLDEATRLGGVISAVIEHQLPVAYMADGQRVPEDLHVARAEGLVQRAVALMRQEWQEEDEILALAFNRGVVNVNL